MTEEKAVYEVEQKESKAVQVIEQASPMALAQNFLASGGDLESLEKMMDLQDRFEKNKAKKEFFVAMANAQKEMPVIYEGRKNSQTGSKYAAYKDIVRGSKPIYTKFGLSVSFYEGDPEKDDYVKFCADVYHEKGHSKTYSVNLPIDDKGPKGTPVKTKIHGVKSSMSYGRGILLGNIFNIPTNEDVDDDGVAAGGKIVPLITENQAIEIRDIIESIEGFSEKDFLEWAKRESIESILACDFRKAKVALTARAKAAKK